MSNPVNTYIELDADGNFVEALAQNRSPEELHEIFAKMLGYKRLGNHLMQINVNGKEETVGVFRLVPEGNSKEKERKRVQIGKKDLTIVPKHLIVVYKHLTNLIFLKLLTSEASFKEMPENVTTLFRVNIRSLAEAFKTDIFAMEAMSRGQMATIVISKNLKLLLERGAVFSTPEQPTYDFGIADGKADDDEKLVNVMIPSLEEISAQVSVGRHGELLAFTDLKNEGPIKKSLEAKLGEKIYEFKWLNYRLSSNSFKESYENYDFLLNGKTHLEIKASSIADSENFYISQIEFDLSQKEKSYLLVKLNINLKNQNVATLENYWVFNGKELGEMHKEVASYKVRIK